MVNPIQTETDWLQSDDSSLMTYFVAEWMSLRKLRLAQVAECRRVEHHLVDERSRHALDVSEAYADGLVSEAVLAEARSIAIATYESLIGPTNSWRDANWDAALSLCGATDTEPRLRMQQIDMLDIALFAPRPSPESLPPELRAANKANAELVRDVFGNPFRPVTFALSLRTETAVSLAQEMYDSRDFSAMAVLAEALEEAGCDNPDIVDHCRAPGPHVRGCWVVDLVLGKE